MAKLTERKAKYDSEWKKKNTRSVVLHINLKEEDVWAKLKSVPNKTGYVMGLIRKDIAENGI